MTSEEEDILRKVCRAVETKFVGRERRVGRVLNVYDDMLKTFPRNVLSHLVDKLDKKGYDVEAIDFTSPAQNTQNFYRKDPRTHLRENQVKFKENLLKDEDGIGAVISPTGSGKTDMVIDLIDIKRVTTLIIVPTDPIKEGLYQRLVQSFGKNNVAKTLEYKEKLKKVYARKKFLTKNNEEHAEKMLSTNEGKYLFHKGYRIHKGGLAKVDEKGEGRFHETNYFKAPPILILCHNSISSIPESYLDQIQLLISDEGHTYSENLLLLQRSTPNCYYRYGFSATYMNDNDFEMKRLLFLFGNKIILEELPQESIAGGRIAPIEISEVDSPKPKFPVDFFYFNESGVKMVKEKQIDSIYKKGIIGNETRNNCIVNLAIEQYSEGRKVLVSVWEQDHTFILEERIRAIDPNIKVMSFHAGLSKKEKSEIIRISSESDEPFIILGTWGLGIGADTKKVDRIILADSRISTGQNVQRGGRGTRVDYEGKKLIIYVFNDWFNEKLREQSRKRLKRLREYIFGTESITQKRFKEIGVDVVRT